MGATLTPEERDFSERVIKNGFLFLRSGWPDFLVYSQDGAVQMGVEIKAGSDKVSIAQFKMHALLRAAGLDVRVVRPDSFGQVLGDLAELDPGLLRHAPPELRDNLIPQLQRAMGDIETAGFPFTYKWAPEKACKPGYRPFVRSGRESRDVGGEDTDPDGPAVSQPAPA